MLKLAGIYILVGLIGTVFVGWASWVATIIWAVYQNSEKRKEIETASNPKSRPSYNMVLGSRPK
jgi:hypothetical protein